MTSKETNTEILKVVGEYLTYQQMKDMLTKLSAVKGNKSFMDSIKNLLKLFK